MPLFRMTKTVLRSTVRKPATVRYPFQKKVFPEGARGRIQIDIDTCIFCGLCQRKCPTHALTVVKEKKTWAIRRLKCIACGYCVEVCPVSCLSMHRQYSASAVKKEEEVHEQS
jgi:ech hydrogenase subunit F